MIKTEILWWKEKKKFQGDWENITDQKFSVEQHLQ